MTVLVIMAISLLVGGALLAAGTYQFQFVRARERDLQALYLAEAGADRALALLHRKGELDNPLLIEGELGRGTYRTRIEQAEGNVVITSTGYLTNFETYKTIEVVVRQEDLGPVSWVELPGEKVE